MAKAFITGINGQDGSYLADLLVREGDEVHGLVRPTSGVLQLQHVESRVTLHRGDVGDAAQMRDVVLSIRPDEIYHLAGVSGVARSFENPGETMRDVAAATLGLFELCRRELPDVRIFHASSAEIFGSPTEQPQNEKTPFRPISPYGCAKAFATQIAQVYRNSLGLFICNGILYNHESPRRGEHFVTRKIARAAARISCGLERELKLGNIAAVRDFGAAEDYVRAMRMTLQHGAPNDYIIATGETHSVREFVEEAFRVVDLKADEYVRIDASLLRPSDPAELVGDASLIRETLGWEPTKRFKDIVREMVDAELREAR